MNENEIKDMAELIKLPIESWLEDTGAIPQATTYYAELISCINDSAEVLFNESYRKVGDDEVVITKREYEQLKKYNRDRKRLRLKWQQAKQETRKILQAINKYLVGTRGIYTIKTFRNCRFEDLMLVRADDLETLVNKLAKEHGVELEE